MLNITLKHLLQTLLVPGSVMVIVWNIYDLTAWLPDTQLSHWIVAGILLTVVSELIVWQIDNKVVIITLVFLCAAVCIATPIWGLQYYRFYLGVITDQMPYFMALFGLFVSTLVWRIYRAGYNILDVQEATGNLPKGSLSKHFGIKRD